MMIENRNDVGRAGDRSFVKRRAYGRQCANTHAHMVCGVLARHRGLGSSGRCTS
jgi:hypothetical protein